MTVGSLQILQGEKRAREGRKEGRKTNVLGGENVKTKKERDHPKSEKVTSSKSTTSSSLPQHRDVMQKGHSCRAT
jgi:hypothetical protein